MALSGRPEHTAAQAERGKALAARLKRARASGFGELALEAFAARAGISPNTLKKLEQGEGNPGFFTVADLAHFLEVPLDELARQQVPRRSK